MEGYPYGDLFLETEGEKRVKGEYWFKLVGCGGWGVGFEMIPDRIVESMHIRNINIGIMYN